jgi:hypothetical protein
MIAVILLLPACSRRLQPVREDEIWVWVDLTPSGGAEAEVWVKGRREEVQSITDLVASSLFPGGVVTSVATTEDDASELHGVFSVVAAFQPSSRVVAGFNLTGLSDELGRLGYEKGSLGFCWPADGPDELIAEPPPDSAFERCAYWNSFPRAVDATYVHEPEPERWLVRIVITLLTGALPVAAIVSLRRSRKRPGGARRALRWSLASLLAFAAVIDFPPVGDPGTSMALAGLAGSGASLALTVAWWVLFALWAVLLYFIGPLLLLISLYEWRRARKLGRIAQPAPSGPVD